MNKPRLTAITRGIGAGKSVVSQILRVMGYEVFDCDCEAKILMDSDLQIKNRLISDIHRDAVDSYGQINRKLISSIVFADKERLALLNSIVHSAVRRRIEEWKNEKHSRCHLFVETAILYQSGLDRAVDDVIDVVAPDEIRIIRVMKRNNCSRQDVISRIHSQQFTPNTPHHSITEIINDNFCPVLPQLLNYLKNT